MVMPKQNKFAVFDIDGTLYRNNLTWDFFNELIHHGLIPRKFMHELERLREEHARQSDDATYRAYDDYLINIFHDNANTIHDMEKYWAIGKEVAQRNTGHLYRYTRDLLHQLKAQNYTLICITNGTGATSRPFALELGFEIVIANDEVIDSESGRIVSWSIHSQKKMKSDILRELIDEHDLDLVNSYGVGDTLSDVSMLDIVNHPIAFNPEQQLYEVAVRNGWPVVVERKNVIYLLDQSKSASEPYARQIIQAIK